LRRTVPTMTKNDLTEIAHELKMSRRERDALYRLTTVVELPAGTLLCRQGEVPRQAMIVLEGTASVLRGGKKVADVGAGDIVGELALVDNVPYRSADVTSTSGMTVAVMTPREFSALRRAVPAFTARVETLAAQRRPV
jgi:CRP/FNR family transcriptional regulator, cyclic AMP receptor protein